MSVTYVDSNVLAPASGRTSIAVPIPNTPANQGDDIAVVAVYKENAAALTPPDGTWTLKGSDTANATTQGALFVFWKRLTANVTGTFGFSWTGSTYAGAHIFVARGCKTSGDPFYSFSIGRTANNSGAVISGSVGSVSGGLGLSFVSSFAVASRSWTVPATWIRPEQTTVQATGYKESMSAGSTGTITWTGNGNDYYQMALGVLEPPSSGSPRSVIVGGVKKTVSGLYVIDGGVKKAATAYVISGGVKKP